MQLQPIYIINIKIDRIVLYSKNQIQFLLFSIKKFAHIFPTTTYGKSQQAKTQYKLWNI